jgi:2-polyprenyl-3-methyl-5-hydroxy-6-metoxy-1,4-benzoquinol methylase
MPTSRPYPISYIADKILENQPKTVLDIGIGFGKYGFLAREYTDIWKNRFRNPQTIIHGIEVYEDYITTLHREIYTNIFIGNALDILPTLGNYDLITFCDVIEHFNKEDGIKMLDLIRSKSKLAFITTPTLTKFRKRGGMNGNAHEHHIYGWSEDELKEWGEVITFNNFIHLLEIS